jgi:hypothetical protein
MPRRERKEIAELSGSFHSDWRISPQSQGSRWSPMHQSDVTSIRFTDSPLERDLRALIACRAS